MKRIIMISILTGILVSQKNDPKDVETLNGIIKAYYEVVSRPAGVLPDRARDKWIHHPNALVSITKRNSADSSSVNTMSIDQYHDSQNSDHGFFEYEVNRQTQRFGNVAQIWSTYAWSTSKAGKIEGRGINSIQLFHDGKRWWIMSWIYDGERKDQPIPKDYLR